MCGIVGVVSVSQNFDRELLDVARAKIRHRGPDYGKSWWSSDGRVGFGHQRLSIIDISSAANQPMVDDRNEICITYNGEIYNYLDLRRELEAKGYTFRTHSDTEVILVAYREWGTNCLAHLNGMFAFAIHDARQQKVILVRDRAGEKPIFYHYTDGMLRFASELKALMVDATLARRVDLESLDCYLAMGYVPGNRCILQGFNKLPSAHVLSFSLQNGDVNVWRYWSLPELDSASAQGCIDESALLDELEVLFEDSVRRQLVADVPVGVLLSGGVDSSLVTAMAVRASAKVKTFTICFPGYGKLDETEHARLIARHFNTEHIELEAESATADLLPRLACQFDEPMADSSMVPTFLVSQLVRRHCAVALGGDGGDELFGGYGHYNRLLWMERWLGLVPRPLRQMISYASGYMVPVGVTGRNWLQALGADFRNGLPLIATVFDNNTRRLLMRRHDVDGWTATAESVIDERVPNIPDLLQRATRMDFSNYLSEDILVKVDRASMLNSLEVRAPLLDCHLIEFAFAKVPSSLKATHQDKKILLKRLAYRVLPPEFDRQRKQGFSIPLSEWLKKGAFRKLFYEVLLDPRCSFDQRTVRELLRGQDRGRNNGERLFALVLFELWRQEYSVAF